MNHMRIAHDPVMRMLLNNFMNQEQQTERKCRWMPATNVTETDHAYQVEMAVPGFSKEDFKINLEKDVLSISTEIENAEKTEEQAEMNYRMREFGRRNFCRSFSIPEAVDKDNIKAEYTNGILMITLPKKEVVKIKKEIQVV
jgi:HSP20 family protein